MAEDEHGRLALQSGFKGLEVQIIAPVVLCQGDSETLAVPVLHSIEKFAVHGSEKENLVSGFGKLPDAGAQRGNDAQTEYALGRIGLPAVAFFLPLADGLKIGVRTAGVAENALTVPRVDGIQNGLGSHEVHVRNPHGEDIPAAEFLFHLIVLGGKIIAPVDGTVKIVLHSFAPS